MEFNAATNRVVNELVVAKSRARESIPPQDALLCVLMSLEAIAPYALLRQLIDVALRQGYRAHPWRLDRNEFRKPIKDASVVLLKQAIVRSIASDLEKISCPDLAGVFGIVHSRWTSHIRNAIAHSTYIPPKDWAKDPWIFSSLAVDKAGRLMTSDLEVSSAEFSEWCRSVLGFRVGLFAACNRALRRFEGEPFEFVSPYPDDTGYYKCRYDRGQIKFIQGGPPFVRGDAATLL